jgi:precorrin-6B methylase 2
MTDLLINGLFIFSILLTLFLFVTVIGHFFVCVPFVPTPYAVVETMISFAGVKDGDVVYDLGAGDARALVAMKKRFPNVQATGIEYIPSVWFLGKVRIWLSRKNITFLCGDALKKNVSDADCIFLYLIPKMMKQLEEKFDKELKPGTRVVSYTFKFYKHHPVKEEEVRWFWWKRKMGLYVW